MADHQNMHPLTKFRQVDWFGGFTAAAGHAVYTARQFPAEFWNRIAFVTEPTGHLVAHGPARAQGERLRHPRPVQPVRQHRRVDLADPAEVGPDGAVWVIDWYNYVVQHNPTPAGFKTGKGAAYETPLRDKTHGRIYRVINETTPLGKSFDLASAGPDVLLAALQSDNMFWRMRAEWKIVETGKKEMIPALVALLTRAEAGRDRRTARSGARALGLAAARCLRRRRRRPRHWRWKRRWRACRPGVRRAAVAVLAAQRGSGPDDHQTGGCSMIRTRRSAARHCWR